MAGSGPKRVGEGGQQRGAGRGGELDGDVDAVASGAAGEQRDHRRRRVGQQAVGGARPCRCPTATGAGAHLVDAEHLERGARADDVDDGVERADLVEVRPRRRSVRWRRALDLGQPLERRPAPLAATRAGKVGGVERAARCRRR